MTFDFSSAARRALALCLLLPACDDDEGPGTPAGLDGLWQTEGYGWIYAIEGEDLLIYETTATSCVQAIGGRVVSEQDARTKTLELEVQGLFKIAMETFPGEDDTQHFLADGLVVSPPAHRITELPLRCTSPAAGDDLAVFDVIWQNFADHYALFEDRDLDWDAQRDALRPRLSGPDPDPLFDVAVELLAPLQDAHVSLFGPDGAFEGRRPEAAEVTDEMLESATALIAESYLQDAPQSWVADQVAFAHLEGGVGYLDLRGFGPLVGEDGILDYRGGLEAVEEAFDVIFADESLPGLVVDLRQNGGGSDLYGMALAQRLTDVSYVPYEIKARVDAADPAVYSTPTPVAIDPVDRPSYDGEVVVLVSRNTVSAAEVCALALRGRPGVTLIGERTQGAFSAVLNHFLPNGWLLGLPNEHYVTLEGERFDVVGLPPDVEVPVFTTEDLDEGRDSAVDEALERLSQ